MSAQIELRFLLKKIEEIESQKEDLETDLMEVMELAEADWSAEDRKKAKELARLERQLTAKRAEYDALDAQYELDKEKSAKKLEDTREAHRQELEDAAVAHKKALEKAADKAREEAEAGRWFKRTFLLTVGAAGGATYKVWLIPLINFFS
jgi:uncharacterized protein (UPF0335 family)